METDFEMSPQDKEAYLRASKRSEWEFADRKVRYRMWQEELARMGLASPVSTNGGE